MRDKTTILITGAGGAAAVSFYNSLVHDYNVFMADMDSKSAGLYKVPKENRLIVPPGRSESFVDELVLLCKQYNIDILVPTVDWELLPIAQSIERFNNEGIGVILSQSEAIALCLDKWRLMDALSKRFEMAGFDKFDAQFDRYNQSYPLLAKPRSESGSRGIKVLNSPSDLQDIACDGSYLIQQYLPGKEYSVDVYLGHKSQVLTSVVRERMKIDSGIAVVSKTVDAPHLSNLAEQMASFLKLRFAANIQFKLDDHEVPYLLEINPRYPGTMPLTVAAGANMPQMAIDELLGNPLQKHYEIKDVAMVRSWQEQFVDPSVFDS